MDFSVTGWKRVIAGTVSGTILCISAALFVDCFNFHNLSEEALHRAVAVDILLPTALAAPLLFMLLRKVQQLAIAHRELSVIASTDSLTAVLNRGAFTMLVDAYLSAASKETSIRSGALLVIDADYFKKINDKLGHQLGDQALKMITKTIKGVLRNADIVGRIGGEEFGVFLPGATTGEARDVAERIRQLINQVVFPPSGQPYALSVSVGGVSFEQRASYDALFLSADRRLYAAKATGRNKVDIGRFVPDSGSIG